MLAVITGASAGIGASFARQLAARGYDLLLIARRQDRLEALARELAADYKISAEPMCADLTDPAFLNRVANRILEAPNLGLLVNNAGFGVPGNFAESDRYAQEQMHRLHVVATVALTHAAIQNLEPRAVAGTGVINVSSVAAFLKEPQSVTYGVTKTWMNAFTECLALSLAGRESPVRMQALCPGFTLTEFHDVRGVDRSTIPASLWMPPDFVVAESLRGFDLGKLIVVPGWRYKAIVTGVKILPAVLISWLSRIAARRQRRLGQMAEKEKGSK